MQSHQSANLHKPFVSLIALLGQKWKKSGRWITILFNSSSFRPTALSDAVMKPAIFSLNPLTTPYPDSPHLPPSLALASVPPDLSVLTTDPTQSNLSGSRESRTPPDGWWGAMTKWHQGTQFDPCLPSGMGKWDSECWLWSNRWSLNPASPSY